MYIINNREMCYTATNVFSSSIVPTPICLTWITGETHLLDRGLRVHYIEMVVFEDAHCGCVHKPTGVRHEHVFIRPGHLTEQQ